MGFDQYHEPAEELPPATRTEGEIVEHGEEAETFEDEDADSEGMADDGSLGIGSLRGIGR